MRSWLSTSGTPRAISGVIKLLKPYECETGMTPKFRSRSVIPIVVANLIAIGEQLLAAEADGARGGGGAGG